MEVFWLLGAFVLLLVYVFDRKVLRFDFKAFRFFVLFVVGAKLITVVLSSFLGVPPLTNTIPPLYYLPLVWWEDILFSLLPIYYARKYLHPNLALATTILSSILFALGHMYQGWFAVIVLSIYPFFISYRYSEKYGYGTVMICHIVYDVIVVGFALGTTLVKSL